MYSCRIFPQTWSQFCIPGDWRDVSSGGAPPKKEDKDSQSGFVEKSITNKKTTMMNMGSQMNISPADKKTQKSNLQFNLHPIAEEGGLSGDKKNTIMNKMSNAFDSNMMVDKPGLHMSGAKKSIFSSLDPASSSMNVIAKTQEKKEKENKETAVIKPKDNIKRVIIKDSEDRWFLNPQYKLEIKPGTKLIITLMQEDELLVNKTYHKVNFVIIVSV